MAFLGLERVHFQDGTQVSTSGQWAAQMGLQVESPRNFSAGPLHGLTGLPNTVAVQFQERKVQGWRFMAKPWKSQSVTCTVFYWGEDSYASNHFQGKKTETLALNDGRAKVTREKSMWDGR